jgi:hypothetical protein
VNHRTTDSYIDSVVKEVLTAAKMSCKGFRLLA